LEIIGSRLLRDLSTSDVRSALRQLTSRYSTRSLQITRNSLDRAIQHAQADDLVARNVAALVKPPKGLWGARTVPLAVTWAFMRLARIR
jgi:hypothetical protein